MANFLEDADQLDNQLLPSSDIKITKVLCSRILKLDPNSSSCYSQWALHLLKQRQYRKAKEKFQRSIKISPDNTDLYDDWLEALYFEREFEELILLVEKYPNKSQYPDNAQNTAGICFLHLGDYENAIKCFQKALSLRKEGDDDELAHFNWALVLYFQGKQGESKEMYEKACQIDRFPVDLYEREVDLLNQDLKREENEIFEDFIKMKMEGFEYFLAMNREKGK